MNKKRKLIYDKFGGKCAYCGMDLPEKGWHVDEVLPVRRNHKWDRSKRKWVHDGTCLHPERFHIDNQYPACASCNINKRTHSLEGFRRLIQGFMKHLNEQSTQYKMAKKYGLVTETNKKVKFWYEIYEPPAQADPTQDT